MTGVLIFKFFGLKLMKLKTIILQMHLIIYQHIHTFDSDFFQLLLG